MATIDQRNGKWRAQVRRKGLGSVSRSFTNKKDAEAWGRLTEAQIERGTFEAHRKPDAPDAKAITLGDLVIRYRDTVSVKKKGKSAEIYILNALLKKPLAKKTLGEVTVAEWSKHKDERLKSIKPVSLKRQFATLSNMYEVAKNEWGYTSLDNPLAKIKIDYVDKKRDRVLKGDEWERIIEDAKARKNPLVLQVILWAKETGMRRGEILAMRWQDVSLKERVLTIPDSKNGSSRQLPITKPMLAQLEGLDPVADRVFPIATANFDSTWKRIMAKLGLSRDVCFHTLRHVAITAFFDRGLNVIEAGTLSGHKTLSMLQRYSHPSPQSILKKLEPVTA